MKPRALLLHGPGKEADPSKNPRKFEYVRMRHAQLQTNLDCFRSAMILLFFKQLQPNALSGVFRSLSSKQVLFVVRRLDPATRSSVLDRIETGTLIDILEHMGRGERETIMKELQGEQQRSVAMHFRKTVRTKWENWKQGMVSIREPDAPRGGRLSELASILLVARNSLNGQCRLHRDEMKAILQKETELMGIIGNKERRVDQLAKPNGNLKRMRLLRTSNQQEKLGEAARLKIRLAFERWQQRLRIKRKQRMVR